ncbi:hypothetical protein [Gemmobacter sp.]|uniref:hypothetical protein n=1 Tax=Gemmobacter sp. TaxID=1898957 RepID=UPI002AFFE76B|nr:hypothetical protein [Gemmobacter sp.]
MTHPVCTVLARATIALTLATAPVAAQNFSTSGQNWSGGWGFSGTAERTLSVQRAQAMQQVENASSGPSTVITYNTWNDNRSNFVDNSGSDGLTQTLDFQVGDTIGQNTNTIGAMNTGQTTIEITGSGNSVSAINGADSNGCLDGSVTNTTYGLTSSTGQLAQGGIDISIAASRPVSTSCN